MHKNTINTGSYRVFGFDPGTLIAGYGCIEIPSEGSWSNPKRFKVVDAGAIKLGHLKTSSEKLAALSQAVLSLIDEFSPSFCVVEKAFFGVNVSTTIKLGESRGVILAAIGSRGLHAEEISPALCKKIVTGQGNANKDVIATMIQQLLGFSKGTLPFDATDALALAVSGVLHREGSLPSLQCGPLRKETSRET